MQIIYVFIIFFDKYIIIFIAALNMIQKTYMNYFCIYTINGGEAQEF